MPNPDGALLSYIIKYNALMEVRSTGIETRNFINEHLSVFKFLVRSYEQHGEVPSEAVVQTRFPDWETVRVQKRDVANLIDQLKIRTKHKDFLALLTEAASNLVDFESTDEVMQNLQAELNLLAMRTGGRNHLVDLLTPETTESMMAEMRARAEEQYQERIQTGLESFDRQAGGLARQKMVVIIGRTGLGKSWLDLLFVAQAVMQGKSVLLYPLEMTLFDTACRLYTIFTQEMFGPTKVLKNMDLQHGTANMRRVSRFLTLLEQQLPGKLHIADMGALSDPYTNERIEADVSLHHPDMFWVDYLTLLKAPAGTDARKDYEMVRMLSNGIKNTAMRCNTVGGCSAQVNRESLKVQSFIPRLEHISYGDSIGQDADLVFSLARKRKGLYYKLVKNRSGPEIGQRRVTWEPNIGLFHEIAEEEERETG